MYNATIVRLLTKIKNSTIYALWHRRHVIFIFTIKQERIVHYTRTLYIDVTVCHKC